MIIEFPNSFEDCKDLDLLDKLTTKEELEGIMFYLYRIAKRMSKQRRFTYEQSPDEIRMRWKEESNAVFELVERSNLLVKKLDKRIEKPKFYSIYVQFCKQKRYTIKSMQTVSQQMKKLGFQEQKSGNERYWLGLDIPQTDEGQDQL